MSARLRAGILGTAMLVLPLLSGCLDAIDKYEEFDPDQHYKNPAVFEGEYRLGNDGSQVLTAGPFKATQPETVYLVSNLPAYPTPTEHATVVIPLAIWRPDNATGPVPIVVDAGPYFEQNAECTERDSNGTCIEERDFTIADAQQRTQWLLANILPHGYAVVQLAIRGTGTAGGCMDLLGDAEQADLDQAITWLGEQPWSNGRIAMVGASYDGSTSWSVAAKGNPYLKTIVPTAGLPDIFDLMFHNGSAESRGPLMHSVVYWGFGFDDDFPQNPGLPPEVPWIPPAGVGGANGRTMQQDLQNVCPEVLEGTLLGPATTVTGDRFEQGSDYWTQRDHRQDVLDNYEGSVFLIHGLQDWNVDPHAAIPFNVALREKGVEMMEWYGQWGHAYPDSTCVKAAPEWVTLPCRLDFAEVLLRWFDRHLKEVPDVVLGPAIQVQDSVGFWRYMDSYPPTDADWAQLKLSGAGALLPEVTGETRIQLMPPTQGAPQQVIELRTEPLAEDLRISGLPQLKLPFEAQGPGGELAVWLLDEDEDGQVRAPTAGGPFASVPLWRPLGVPVVGHAAMNLRYHAGGEQEQTLVPNERYVAQIEFEPLEVLIPKGHRLTMWVFQFAYPDRQTALTPSPVTVILGPDAVLHLPTVDADPTTLFPVPGAHFPARDNLSMMYVAKPLFQPASPVPLPIAAAATADAARLATCDRLGVACP